MPSSPNRPPVHRRSLGHSRKSGNDCKVPRLFLASLALGACMGFFVCTLKKEVTRTSPHETREKTIQIREGGAAYHRSELGREREAPNLVRDRPPETFNDHPLPGATGAPDSPASLIVEAEYADRSTVPAEVRQVEDESQPLPGVGPVAMKAPKNTVQSPPQQRAKERPKENTYFTLSLSGRLGDQQLDPQDARTWARIGYFLQQEAQTPFFLVYPGSKAPVIKKKGREGRLEPLKRKLNPKGDPPSPAYRLVIEAEANLKGRIQFYGQSLGNKFTCKLACRLEKLVGKEVQVLERFFVTDTLSSVTNAEPQVPLRQVYDQAVEKMLPVLGAVPLLRRGSDKGVTDLEGSRHGTAK